MAPIHGFKMNSQPVHCKRVRSQVSSNNNPLFYFSTKDVAKTACMHFVKSILMHSLLPRMQAKNMSAESRSGLLLLPGHAMQKLLNCS